MKHIHFIAIGGAVMHQLALALQQQGNIITGSDDDIQDPAKTNLKAAGLLPAQYGWFPERIHAGLDAVVLGMHAKEDNPELKAAQQLQVPVFSFPEYVYEVSQEKKRVVVAGSHGKTTITSMIMHALKQQGAKFDYLVGAKVEGFEQSVQLSDAPVIILEGDEYPASAVEKRPKIFFYHPDISVLSGIAWDHINVFPTYENYYSQFEQYIGGMKPGTLLLYNQEDPEVCRLVQSFAGYLRAIPYGMPVYRYESGIAIVDTEDGPVSLSVFGSHNLLNMQAALAVCRELGVAEKEFYQSIASFTGAARRLERIAETENIVAFRDFAHAPSKLKATLDAVREAYPQHRLIACFELHTYSSLNADFLGEYAHCMDAADEAVVFFSRHALDLKKLPLLAGEQVLESFARRDMVVMDNRDELAAHITRQLHAAAGPVCLLLMSSGTFEGIDWKNVVSHH